MNSLQYWKDILLKDEITASDWFNMEYYSTDWEYCPCGQFSSIPRLLGSSQPVDVRLYNLGMDFYYDISHKNSKAALKTISLIEDRVAEILKHQRSPDHKLYQ